MKSRGLLSSYSCLLVLGTVLTQVQPPLKPRAVARAGSWPAARSSNQARPGETLPAAARAQLVASYGKLPLSFEANRGQTDGAVKFLSRGHGYTLFLTSTEAVLALRKAQKPEEKQIPRYARDDKSWVRVQGKDVADQGAVIRMELVGANPVSRASGAEELPGKVNYFLGNDPKEWRTNVSTYAKVRYEDVYPGIDLIYYGNQRQLEYDFVVAPGADPGRIRLRFDGAERIELDAEGNLVLETPTGTVQQHKPAVYQPVGGVKQAIGGGYVLKGKNEVGFEVASYDPRYPLILDPVLAYSTYLGGGGGDVAAAIAVDSAGNAYVTGATVSLDFPTASPLQVSISRGVLAFVAKLNAAGAALVYSTYLGSTTDQTNGRGIAVDSAGNAYVTGSTGPGFPMALQATYGGGVSDAFLVKLNPAGTALVYSTYLGGNQLDGAYGVAVDSAGNAYVTGFTNSNNFPTVNAFQANFGGTQNVYLGGDLRVGDAFVAKLNAAGSALVYSTYLGGTADDWGSAIAVDSAGNAYVTGTTRSFNFPTANALQASSGLSQPGWPLAWISTDNYSPKCEAGFPERGSWSSVMVTDSTRAR